MPAELDEAASARELDERGMPAELDEAALARELDERGMPAELDEATHSSVSSKLLTAPLCLARRDMACELDEQT